MGDVAGLVLLLKHAFNSVVELMISGVAIALVYFGVQTFDGIMHLFTTIGVLLALYGRVYLIYRDVKERNRHRDRRWSDRPKWGEGAP